AMLDVLSRPGARDPEIVLAAVADAVTGIKAADREKQKAGIIGTAVHAGIEWYLRTQLGEDAGPEPRLPDAAMWALESWKDWARSCSLEPLAIERTVYCFDCGYAGTLDLYARVKGVLTILDWKSGKAIYPEAFLQNVAYRHAAARGELPSAQGLIVRLPKRLDDPAWEVMPVPDTSPLDEFLAALHLWRWHRRMEGHRVVACELAWEVHARGYWSQLRRSNGSPYETEEAYFREVLGLASWRTAYKRLAIGRMLWSFGEAERAAIRAAIATLGLAKASIV